MLEAALLVLVLLSVTMAVPAIVENNHGLIRLHGVYLLLAGIVAMLSALERLATAASEAPATRAGGLAVAEPAAVTAADRGALRRRILLWLCANERETAA
jgi:hypothetical protein